MAIGLITSPASWLLGTIVSPTWLQQVQDGNNAVYNMLIGGTVSAASLALDGIGNVAASPAPGQLRIGQSAIANTALAVFRDRSGNMRSSIDHCGYPAGKLNQWIEPWGIPTTSLTSNAIVPAYARWSTSSISGTGAVAGLAPGVTGYPAPSISITPGTGAAAIQTTTGIWVARAFSDIVVEFDFWMNAIGANNVFWYLGLFDSIVVSGQTAIYFSKRSTDTNWQCETHNAGAASTSDSGVAPVVNTAQRMRIEYHGASSAYGAATVTFFINETQVYTTTTNAPAAGGSAGLFIAFYGSQSAGNSTVGNVGIVRYTANNFADPITAI